MAPERALSQHTTQEKMNMTRRINIEGMACAHCSGRVEQALRGVSGVTDVQVDLAAKCAVVKAEGVGDETLTQAVTNSGYTVTGIE